VETKTVSKREQRRQLMVKSISGFLLVAVLFGAFSTTISFIGQSYRANHVASTTIDTSADATTASKVSTDSTTNDATN